MSTVDQYITLTDEHIQPKHPQDLAEEMLNDQMLTLMQTLELTRESCLDGTVKLLTNTSVWFVGVERLFVTVMDISRPCQPEKCIPLLP